MQLEERKKNCTHFLTFYSLCAVSMSHILADLQQENKTTIFTTDMK